MNEEAGEDIDRGDSVAIGYSAEQGRELFWERNSATGIWYVLYKDSETKKLCVKSTHFCFYFDCNLFFQLSFFLFDLLLKLRINSFEF